MKDKINSTSRSTYRGTYKKDVKLKNKRKKRRKVLKALIFIFIIVGFITAIAISPACNTKSVYVSGKTRYDKNELFNASGIIIGINSFKNIGVDLFGILNLRDKKAEENLKNTFPYIETVKVMYRPFSKFEISIHERLPFVIIKYRNEFIVTDKEGIALENTKDKTDFKLPIFVPILEEGYKLGSKIKFNPTDALINVEKILNKIKISDTNDDYKLYNVIQEIKNDADGNIILNLENKIDANIGNGEDINYRIDFLRTIYKSVLKTGETGYLDFTLEGKPVLKPKK